MKPNQELYEQRESFFLKLSSSTKGAFIFFVAFGLIIFVVGIGIGEQTRTWGSFLFNWMFFFSIALGGAAFGGMQDAVGAEWGRPIKRLHESYSSFLPYAMGLLIFFLFCIKFKLLGAQYVYSWIADPEIVSHFHGKDIWLHPDFMIWRDICSLVIILVLVRWHMNLTIGPDRLMLMGRYDDALKAGQASKKTLSYWSAPVLLIHALCFSILAFDLTMSLAPTWFSTLWAGWSFAILMQILLATTSIAMFCLKDSSIGQYIGRQQFHDLGKLLFGFTAFYAYLTYAHVLTYWYTNVPEETSYFITRLNAPWLSYILAAPFISFLFPFVMLIPKANKWTSYVTIPVCIIIIAAQWLNYMLVVLPEIVPAGNQLFFPWIELGLFLGFLGVFLLSFFRFAEKTPMLSIADPLLHSVLKGHH